MKGWQSIQLFLSPLFVAMFCTTLAGGAMAAECRLDWNGDYQIALDDYNNESEIGGFYAEWYLFLYTPYYPVFFPGADSSRLDYNGDGTIDAADLMGTLNAAAETEGFYSEWYIFMYTPYYAVFFPEYDVCPPLPAPSCPAVDYVDVGGPNAIGEPRFLTPLNGKIYMRAFMPSVGFEVQVYDPATGTVTNAVDANPGVDGSNPWDLFAHAGKLYFSASTPPDWTSQLYEYDPATGVTDVIEINATGSGNPRYFMSGSNGKLYFEGRTANAGNELHSYDPVTGDLEYWDLYPGIDQYGMPYHFSPKEMVEYNGKIYMQARGTEGLELYAFDLTTEQATRLSNIHPGYSFGNPNNSYPQDLTVFNEKIFFQAADDGAVNYELWIYDPATGDLREIVIDDGMGILQGSLSPAGAGPSQFVEWGGKLYMRAQQVPVGVELFVYDPVTDTVTMAWDSYPGQYNYCAAPGVPPCMMYGNDGHTDELTLKGDKIYYVAHFDNKELWEYDLVTGQGTQFLEIFPGLDEWGSPNHSAPFDMVQMDGNLYFRASNEPIGYGSYQEFFMVTWAPENCS